MRLCELEQIYVIVTRVWKSTNYNSRQTFTAEAEIYAVFVPHPRSQDIVDGHHDRSVSAFIITSLASFVK